MICSELTFNFIFSEHSYSTTLDLVGRQIWRGALLLGDFILHHGSSLLQDHTVLELGSGVGLTSIVAAMFASEVICTGHINILYTASHHHMHV
jgi:predicted nicotinamide N-methyase